MNIEELYQLYRQYPSKLAIIIALSYLLYTIVFAVMRNSTKKKIIVASLSIIMLLSALVFTRNPIRSRFSDALSGNMFLFKQDTFSPDVYFNGVQLRLLMWRFTYEILQEKNSWLIGVSTGDAQYELNRKFAETNVYLGDGKNDKLGYRAFNSHNVFLQTVLESGLVGLCFLLGIIISFFFQAFNRKNKPAIIFFLGILAFCLTESVLSSQYAILLFMFFPLLSLNVQKVLNEY
jgi:O-antigen ligase